MKHMPRSCRFALVLLASGVALLSTSRVDAYCRALTQAPPKEFDQTVSCFEGSAEARQLYWLNDCVGYSLQQNASQEIDLASATEAAAQAFAAWRAVDCGGGAHPSIDATHDMGPVGCDKVEYNNRQPNQHVILLRDGAWPYPGSANTLGLTTLRPDPLSGEVFDADIEINAPAVAQEAALNSAVSLQSVLLHEIGHYLGLAHSTDSDAVMFAFYKPVSMALTQDDIDGICAIYPPDGTRSTSAGSVPKAACDPTPRHGFSAQCSVPGADVADPAPTASTGGCSLASGQLGGARQPASALGNWGFWPGMAVVLSAIGARVRSRKKFA
jgi:hypothetical protein